MLTINDKNKIYVYTEAVDMRKAVNGLSAYVVDEFDKSPQSGDLFVFWNKSKNRLKILWWDKNGFIIHYKRIERHRFKIPKDLSGESFEITSDQLNWLLAGLEFTLMQEFNELNYSDFY